MKSSTEERKGITWYRPFLDLVAKSLNYNLFYTSFVINETMNETFLFL